MVLNNNAKSALLLLLCVAALVGTFTAGRHFHFDTMIPGRQFSYALPAAISYLYYGLKGYTFFGQLFDVFEQSLPPTEQTFQTAIHLTSIDHTNILFAPADDKSTIDLAIFSLVLFGPHVKSLYYGFFVLLGISAGCLDGSSGENQMPLAR